MKDKYLMCDTSSLISLTNTGYIDLLYYFHKDFGVRFIIPFSVMHEAVERPLKIRNHEHSLSALRIQKAINDKVLEVVQTESPGRTQMLEDMANKIFFAKGKPMTLIHGGEMSTIAFAKETQIDNLLIDERTTRLMIEAPFRYKEHIEQEFNTQVLLNRENFNRFKEMTGNLKIFRSVELLIVAYEQGYLDDYKGLKRDVLQASLYQLKYSGCAVSNQEIEHFLSTVK